MEVEMKSSWTQSHLLFSISVSSVAQFETAWSSIEFALPSEDPAQRFTRA